MKDMFIVLLVLVLALATPFLGVAFARLSGGRNRSPKTHPPAPPQTRGRLSAS